MGQIVATFSNGELASWELWTYDAATDTTSPTVTGMSINAAGTQLTVATSEDVTAGADGWDDFTLSFSGGAVTASYNNGDGSQSIVYDLSRTIEQTEGDGTGAYGQPGDGIQDPAGNLLATFSGTTVTNNSSADVTSPTLTGPGAPDFDSGSTRVESKTRRIYVLSKAPGVGVS